MNKTFKRILAGGAAAVICAGAAIGSWHLFDANVDRSGWKLETGNYYYQDFHANLVTGWQDIDGKRYYFGDDHIMYTGWREVDGKRCYFGQNGALHTGWQDIGSGRYFLGDDGALRTGWQDIDGARYYFGTVGTMTTGWLVLDGQRYYFNEDGTLASGWKEIGGAKFCFNTDGTPYTGLTALENRYYHFDDSGIMTTGWLNLGDYKHYFKEDGTMAVGPTVIGEQTYYFSPRGVHILLVNPWNYVPDDYAPELVMTEDSYLVNAECLEALEAMLADCRKSGLSPAICSAYRTQADQEYLFNRKIRIYMSDGMSEEQAYDEAKLSVAIPGTSEHQLGLALDIIADDYWVLDDSQATTRVQQWLMANCWNYGFILRYPEGKTSITGIVYEPWHYRYVGVEIAMELRDLGITLEEYLGAVPAEG